MNKNKDILKIVLAALIAVFLMLAAGVLFLNLRRSAQREEMEREQAQDALDHVPTKAPTPTVTVSPTPSPTITPTPTPVPTRGPSFQAEDYLGMWYSTDGLVSVDVYSLNQSSVSFYLSQALDGDGTRVSESDVTADVAGNAAQFAFTDSFGSRASGSMIFDSEGLYVDISTTAQADGVPVSPDVNGMLTREQPVPGPDPTATPVPEETPDTSAEEEGTSQTGDYFFPESDSRYLTDEEISRYSSSDLELAKNEIYARHGRKFVTQRIADYFNSKSWYEGTIDPETFDAQQDSVFNEYETANIARIAQWEARKREEGE